MEKTAQETDIPYEIVEQMVYEGQWRSAFKALKNYKSVELTGLGKFVTREKKVCELLEKRLSSYEEISKKQFTDYNDRRETRLQKLEKDINYLINKLNQIENVNRFNEQKNSVPRYIKLNESEEIN